jgi:hypothetical protein
MALPNCGMPNCTGKLTHPETSILLAHFAAYNACIVLHATLCQQPWPSLVQTDLLNLLPLMAECAVTSKQHSDAAEQANRENWYMFYQDSFATPYRHRMRVVPCNAQVLN